MFRVASQGIFACFYLCAHLVNLIGKSLQHVTLRHTVSFLFAIYAKYNQVALIVGDFILVSNLKGEGGVPRH